MSKLTLDTAIKHCLEVTEQNDTQAKKWQEEGGEQWGKTTACRECAADHRQLAEWLMELKDLRAEQNDQYVFIHELMTELKDLREENKVLMQECDRLIKEKGELLNKVSGGDVLRICQLEEQLQVELDNNHCLEIELKEAKRLLKVAMEDMNTLYETGKDEGCIGIKFKWRFADEALKLIGDESSGV